MLALDRPPSPSGQPPPAVSSWLDRLWDEKDDAAALAEWCQALRVAGAALPEDGQLPALEADGGRGPHPPKASTARPRPSAKLHRRRRITSAPQRPATHRTKPRPLLGASRFARRLLLQRVARRRAARRPPKAPQQRVQVVFHDLAFQLRTFTAPRRAQAFLAELRQERCTFAALQGGVVLEGYYYNEEWRRSLFEFIDRSGLRAGANAPPQAGGTLCKRVRPTLRSMIPLAKKKVIAYSLFGGLRGATGHLDAHHSAIEYIVGAHVNCEHARRLYPGWVVRLYYDQSIPTAVLARLSAHPNLELVFVWNPFAGDEEEADGRATRRGKRTNYFGTTWRLLPYDDPSVGVFLSRDLDDALDAAGREHVAAWEAADHLLAHRQSAEDRYLVNAGWCGLKRGALPTYWSMKERIAAWCLPHGGRSDVAYCTDERFLSEEVWPAVGEARSVALSHSRPEISKLAERWQRFMQLPEREVRPVQVVGSWR